MNHRRTLRKCALFTSLTSVIAACGAEAPSGDTLPAAPSTATSAAPTASGEGVTQELAFPGRTGEIRTGKFQTPEGIQELTYESIDGKAVYQGDMILADEDEPNYRSGGVASVGARWPYGIVPVEAWGLYNDARVRGAIDYIQKNTPIRFSFTYSTSIKRLRFVSSSVAGTCNSPVGMTSGTGSQDINLASNCSMGNVIHEISHSLGLYHEQSRSDRDTYITMNWPCIKSSYVHDFDPFGTSGINIGPYETNSIMHYGSRGNYVDTTKAGCQVGFWAADGSEVVAQRTAYTPGDLEGINALYQAWTLRQRPVDWDGDGYDDIAVWRPSNAKYYIRQSSNGGTSTVAYGESTDVPVPEDYDGDGIGDFAVFRPRTGQWFVTPSTVHVKNTVQWGVQGDIPTPGDFDGDGWPEPSVFRPNEGKWYLWRTTSPVDWGQAGDIPVQRDWDGDGYTDVAVWRPTTGDWWLTYSSGVSDGYDQLQWGLPGDIPVPGDYNGDGWPDLAVWRPSDGYWYIIVDYYGGIWWKAQWGLYGDVPAPMDYDGDGTTDLVVYRPTEGKWYVNGIGVVGFGTNGDVPTP